MGMRTYIAGLARPVSWNDLADFLSKTVFAAAAATVALVASCQSEARSEAQRLVAAAEKKLSEQAAQFAADKKDLREALSSRRDEITLFLDYMQRRRSDPQWSVKLPVLSSYCSEDQRFEITHAVSKVLCQQVSRAGDAAAADNKDGASELAAEAARTGDPGRYLNSTIAETQNSALAASESAVAATSDRWFAVVASVPGNQPEVAARLAKELNGRLQRAGLPPKNASVYRTRISNSFAITSGRDKTEAEAKARARMLRQSDAVPDAFAQRDRGWTRLTDPI